MSGIDFTVVLVRPCVKCGATERNKYGQCRPCTKARLAAWYAANADKELAKAAARYAANPDKKKASSAAWREANPDKVKAQIAAWNAANPDKKKAKGAEWYASNPDKVKTQRAAWTAANPGAKLIYGHNYRARTRAAGGTLSKDLAAKLFKLQKGKCPCCKQPLGDDYHLDHITPLFLGGTNSDENIQLLRAKCNMQKSKKEPIQFMQSRGFLI